jgi:hypothetical protein
MPLQAADNAFPLGDIGTDHKNGQTTHAGKGGLGVFRHGKLRAEDQGTNGSLLVSTCHGRLPSGSPKIDYGSF